jgi:hypothetical protein
MHAPCRPRYARAKSACTRYQSVRTLQYEYSWLASGGILIPSSSTRPGQISDFRFQQIRSILHFTSLPFTPLHSLHFSSPKYTSQLGPSPLLYIQSVYHAPRAQIPSSAPRWPVDSSPWDAPGQVTRAKRPGGSSRREQDQGVYTTDETVSREGGCG